MATIMEAIIHEQIELNDWLGPDAETITPSQYDVIANGVDSIIRFQHEGDDDGKREEQHTAGQDEREPSPEKGGDGRVAALRGRAVRRAPPHPAAEAPAAQHLTPRGTAPDGSLSPSPPGHRRGEGRAGR
mgnify:CR=1 FL=1